MGSPASHPLLEECSHAPHPSHSLGKQGLVTPPPLTQKERAKHVHFGDDKTKDAMRATLDQMDPGVPLKELVWTQSARYFLRTCSTALYTQGAQEVQRGLQ